MADNGAADVPGQDTADKPKAKPVSMAKRIRQQLEAEGKLRVEPNVQRNTGMARPITLAEAHHAKGVLFDFPHGLGDCVQFVAALRHLRFSWPERVNITVRCQDAYRPLFAGVANALPLDAETERHELYRRVRWAEARQVWGRWPSTKMARFLRDELQIAEPKSELFTYAIEQDKQAEAEAVAWLQSVAGVPGGDGRYAIGLLHWRGRTVHEKKNLFYDEAVAACEAMLAAGLTPVVVDDAGAGPLTKDAGAISFPKRGIMFLYAVAARAAVCVGIDSGPGHLFGATGTPTLICWTAHHPLHFYHPCEQVTHLIPEDHASRLYGSTPEGLHYLRESYRTRTYGSLLDEIGPAITDVLQAGTDEGITLNVAAGLGDIFWVYQLFAPHVDKINFNVTVLERDDVQFRSFKWLELLPKCGRVRPRFVRIEEYSRFCGKYYSVPETLRVAKQTGRAVDFCANRALEEGWRLDELGPACEWAVPMAAEPFTIKATDGYIVFAISGSTGGAKDSWPKERWADFIRLFYDQLRLGQVAVFIGAEFDRPLVEWMAKTLAEDGYLTEAHIARHPAQVLSIIAGADYFVGYQSGLNIMADNMGKAQAMIYFSELAKMQTTWVRPDSLKAKRFHSFTFSDSPEKIVAALRFAAVLPASPLYHRRALHTSRYELDGFGGYEKALHFVVPSGIGDISWIYSKLRHVPHLYGKPVLVSVAGDLPHRSAEFVQMLPDVWWAGYDAVTSWQVHTQCLPSEWTDVMGHGFFAGATFAQNISANIHLERGLPLSEWMPRLPTSYHYPIDIPNNNAVVADRLVDGLEKRVAVYVSGHGGWGLWQASEWVEFLRGMLRLPTFRDAALVFIGAEWDRPNTELVQRMMDAEGATTRAIIGRPLGVALHTIKTADFYVGYPSGLSILANVMGTPAIMFLPSFLGGLEKSWPDPVDVATFRYRVLVDPSAADAVQYVAKYGVRGIEWRNVPRAR